FRDTSLSGVSCVSPTGCTVVGTAVSANGQHSEALSERWNGRRWRMDSLPRLHPTALSALSGISCTSPTACFAVGQRQARPFGSVTTLVERLSRGTWSVQRSDNPHAALPDHAPNPLTLVAFKAVSCSSAASCTAVGVSQTIDPRAGNKSAASFGAMLVERWN